MKIEKEGLLEAGQRFIQAVAAKDQVIKRDEALLGEEGNLRAISLLELINLIAKPSENSDEELQIFFREIKTRLFSVESEDPRDRTLTFGGGSSSDMNFHLQGDRIWPNESLANEKGTSVVSLRLNRKPSRRQNPEVYFRQRIEKNSTPYILVQYSDKEQYFFGLDVNRENLVLNDSKTDGEKQSEDVVRTDLFKTCNAIGHNFGLAVDPEDISIARNMGAEMLNYFSRQLENQVFIEG